MPFIDLTDPAVLADVLRKKGVSPTAELGQNFLLCPEPIEAILAAMDAGTKQVTELGPGLGTLTQALLANTYTVRAIEKDKQLAEVLVSLLPKKSREQLTLIAGDLRHEPWSDTQPWQLVGNIPYNLSGLIFRTLTELPHQPTQAIFMVQREVGENATAEAPHMNMLALSLQLWGTAHQLLAVPATCFRPQPKVHSMLVMLVPHATPTPLAEREAVLKTAKQFFQHKRKQLGGILRKQLHIADADTAAILAALDVAPTVRPQELTLAQWRQVTTLLAEQK